MNDRQRNMPNSSPSKSTCLAGLQCIRRLWLQVNEPKPYQPPVHGSLMDVGQKIGRMGRLLFPNGVLIDEELGTMRKPPRERGH